MGKSDITITTTKIDMSETNRPKLFTIGPCQKDPDEYSSSGLKLSSEVEMYTNQAAGHMTNGKTVGLLKQNGTVLKPILKTACSEKEFYEELNKNNEDCSVQLKQFVPQYCGTKTVMFDDKKIDCIVLEDLTKNFKQPCILDVKIGRQTWAPTASYEKMMREDNKYHETKRDLGICIPGFLVYDVASGKVDRYDKDYGKTLNRESIKEALKLFLNANVGLNRDLLLQFVVELWKILRWARLEKKFQLFSSSLLFVYDAKRLKKKVVAQHATEKPLRETRNQSLPSYDTNLKRFNLYKPLSLLKLNDSISTGFSGLFTKEGPILCSLPSKIKHFCSTSVRDKTRRSSEQVNRLRRVHSFQNNYDKDLQKIRKDYKVMLRTLVDEEECETWAVVKMIDFAHVHTIAHNEVDKNYLEGIESLVKLFEEFLGETGNS